MVPMVNPSSVPTSSVYGCVIFVAPLVSLTGCGYRVSIYLWFLIRCAYGCTYFPGTSLIGSYRVRVWVYQFRLRAPSGVPTSCAYGGIFCRRAHLGFLQVARSKAGFPL